MLGVNIYRMHSYRIDFKEKMEAEHLYFASNRINPRIYTSENNTINQENMTNILKKVEFEIKNTTHDDPCRTNLLMTQLWMQVNDLTMH